MIKSQSFFCHIVTRNLINITIFAFIESVNISYKVLKWHDCMHPPEYNYFFSNKEKENIS